MKTNERLQQDVQDALKWEPLLNAAEIGVIVKDGIVTLTGTVDSYLKKSEAENATRNVAGVKAVVEKIDVRFKHGNEVNDADIAREVLNAFKWNSLIPAEKIKVRVENGCVTLDGELDYHYQVELAKNTVISLVGVRSVSSNLKIKLTPQEIAEARHIKKALRRNWSINADDIDVQVTGSKVTLRGTVYSFYQKKEAERIAWQAPGVWEVENNLIVEFTYSMAE